MPEFIPSDNPSVLTRLCEKHLEWAKTAPAEEYDAAIKKTGCPLCVIDGMFSPLSKSIDDLRQRLEHKCVELTAMREAAEHRNRELDALHYVWCSGGCEKGVHRYCSNPDEITEATVQIIERQAKRLREWLTSRQAKKEGSK